MEIFRVFSKKKYFSIKTNRGGGRNSGRILEKKWNEDISRYGSQKIVRGEIKER